MLYLLCFPFIRLFCARHGSRGCQHCLEIELNKLKNNYNKAEALSMGAMYFEPQNKEQKKDEGQPNYLHRYRIVALSVPTLLKMWQLSKKHTMSTLYCAMFLLAIYYTN